MTKPLLILGLSSLALVLFGWGVYELATPRSIVPGDAWRKYEGIRVDMTEADVVRICGTAAGDYSTGDLTLGPCGTGDPREDYLKGARCENCRHETWRWDDGIVEVIFSPDGNVVGKHFVPVWPPRSFFGRARDWLRWGW